MTDFIPPQPKKSYRIALESFAHKSRLDSILLAAIREQDQNLTLQNISRTQYKELFNTGKIQIKGQNARPSSTITRGITYIDILGY